jgi:hypothetical protein
MSEMLLSQKMSAIRTAQMLETQLRAWYPKLARLKLQIEVQDLETAGTTVEHNTVKIVLPQEFCGEPAVGQLAMGLSVHELGHAFYTDVAGWRKRLPDYEKRQDGQLVLWVANAIEDVRTERMFDFPFQGHLGAVRALVAKTQGERLEKTGDITEVFMNARFASVETPFLISPMKYKWQDEFLGDVAAFAARRGWMSAKELFNAAQTIVNKYRKHLPEDPPKTGMAGMPMAGDGDGDGEGQGKSKAQSGHGKGKPSPGDGDGTPGGGDGEKCPGVVVGNGVEGPEEDQASWGPQPGGYSSMKRERPNKQLEIEGRALGRKMQKGWAKRQAPKYAVGVGRYRPNLDKPGAAIPPFVLPMPQRQQLPSKVVIMMDVSGSMLYGSARGSDGRLPITNARVCLAALDEAITRAGGQTKLIIFASYPVEVDSVTEGLGYVDGGTDITFLADLTRRYRQGWEFIILTDAEIHRPPVAWTEQFKARTTVVHIGNGDGAYKLGNRVLEVKDTAQLVNIVTRAARAVCARNRG